ncbi:MAG: hypothetical protein F4X97_15030 [Boseongicola sp. SB0662_bin_57]|nr:hypothetical protein [Boseongicola sp. SB0662_bin_57]
MSMIRPEARAFLSRWQEAILSGIVLLGSLQAAALTTGLVRGLSYAAALVCAALFIEGVRRGRLPDRSTGAGRVEVDERQITHFTSLGRGEMSVDDLVRVKVRPGDRTSIGSDFFWEFTDIHGQRLTISGDVGNGAALFDALTALPGADLEAAIRVSGPNADGEQTVWEAAAKRPD